MKWFSSKGQDPGPQLLSLSPLRLDEEPGGEGRGPGDDGVFFPGTTPSAPATPSEMKRRSRGRSISPWLRRKLRQDSIDEEERSGGDENGRYGGGTPSYYGKGAQEYDPRTKHMSYSGRIRCWSPPRAEGIRGGSGQGSLMFSRGDGGTFGFKQGNSPLRRAPLPNLEYSEPKSLMSLSTSKLSRPASMGFTWHHHKHGKGLTEFQPKGSQPISLLNTDEMKGKSLSVSRLPLDLDQGEGEEEMQEKCFIPPPGSQFGTDGRGRSRESSPCLKRINRHHLSGSMLPHCNSQTNLSGGGGGSNMGSSASSTSTLRKVVGLPPLPLQTKKLQTFSPASIDYSQYSSTLGRSSGHSKKSGKGAASPSDNGSSIEALKLKLKEVSDKCFNSGKMSSASRLFSRFSTSNKPSSTSGHKKMSSSSSTGRASPASMGRKVRSFSFGGMVVPPLDDLDGGVASDLNSSGENYEFRVNPLYMEEEDLQDLVNRHHNDGEEDDDPFIYRNHNHHHHHNQSHSVHRIPPFPSSRSDTNLDYHGLSMPKSLDFITSTSTPSNSSSAASHNSDGDSGIVNEMGADGNSLFQEESETSPGSNSSCSTSSGNSTNNSNSCCSVRFNEELTSGHPAPPPPNKKPISTSNQPAWVRRVRHHSSKQLENNTRNSSDSSSTAPSKSLLSYSRRHSNSSSNLHNQHSSELILPSPVGFDTPPPPPSPQGEYRLVRLPKACMSRPDLRLERNAVGESSSEPSSSSSGYLIRYIHPDSEIARLDELRVSDEIISINGKFVRDVPLQEVYSMLGEGASSGSWIL